LRNLLQKTNTYTCSIRNHKQHYQIVFFMCKYNS
jgi:hypothetical protein